MTDQIDLTQLITALASAKAQFPPLTTDAAANIPTKSGGGFSYRYITLAALHAAVDGVLSDNGLVLIEPVIGDTVVAMLLHTSGASIESRITIGNPSSDMRAYGSDVTYARRYAAMSLLGLAADDSDGADAGSAGRQVAAPVPTPRAPQRASAVDVDRVVVTHLKVNPSATEENRRPRGWLIGRKNGQEVEVAIWNSQPIKAALGVDQLPPGALPMPVSVGTKTNARGSVSLNTHAPVEPLAPDPPHPNAEFEPPPWEL